MSTARLTVDSTRCQGHGRCYAIASSLFEYDDEGYGIVKHEALPPAQIELAQQAVDDCPERAISLAPAEQGA
jgi:ferredoxin